VDVAVAVGGDGTVQQVAVALAAGPRHGPPLIIVPTGTANNIARALGIAGTAAGLADRLSGATRRRLAVGTARATWGETRFVESAGVGIFASLLGEGNERPTDEAIAHLRQTLGTARPRRLTIDADGRDRSGDYVLAVAMNIGAIGPRLALAPQADPGDDRMELVLVTADDKRELDDYLLRLAAGEPRPWPGASHPARRIRMEWAAADGHADDARWPENGGPAGHVTLEIETYVSVLVC
jgi:diacylglycerol kinase family enzyme